MKTRFFRNKKNNWICITTTGLVCVEGSIDDPFTFVNSNVGIKVENNLLFGFSGTAIEGTLSQLHYTTQAPAVDVSAFEKAVA